jgi:hypothetical protein
MIRFDQPGTIVEYVPTKELAQQQKNPISIDERKLTSTRSDYSSGTTDEQVLEKTQASEVKPRSRQLKLVTTTHRQIRYEHASASLQILDISIVLATSNPSGQLESASLTISGLVHDYSGADNYEYAAERSLAAGNFALTEFIDTAEPTQWYIQAHILLYVAEFRDNAENFGKPGTNAKDQRQFIILKQLEDGKSKRYERVGTARLVNMDGMRSLARAWCSYTPETGWMRKTVVIV